MHGYDRETTPELKRWAAEGVTFDWAFSDGALDAHLNATMFTGLYPNQFVGNFERPVNAPIPMLAEMFRSRGYVTGGFVANLSFTPTNWDWHEASFTSTTTEALLVKRRCIHGSRTHRCFAELSAAAASATS